MIEAICNSLTKKIIKSVDGYDESKADEISFGLQLLIGEVPKFFITFILAWILNIIDLTIISFIHFFFSKTATVHKLLAVSILNIFKFFPSFL